MCTVRTPKPVQVQPAAGQKEKRVAVLRNPYLDGIEPTRRAQQVGVGSFRIDRSPSGTARVARPTTGTPPAALSLQLQRTPA